jgi:hypothetical protein
MELVRRTIPAAVPPVDPLTGSISKFPSTLNGDVPFGVKMELQLEQAEAYELQLRAVQKPKIQIRRHAVHPRILLRLMASCLYRLDRTRFA